MYLIILKKKIKKDAEKAVEHFKGSFYEKITFSTFKKSNYTEGAIITVTPAHEPTDIRWENREYSNYARLGNRLVTFLATFLLLAICAGFVILISWGQVSLFCFFIYLNYFNKI